MRVSQRCFLLAGIVFVFLLVGCGQNAGSDATPPPTDVSVTPTSLEAPTTSSSKGTPATPHPANVPATKPPPLPPTLAVTLLVGAVSYQRGGIIIVTIKNQSGQTISFADHRTNCTVLLLERQVATSWEPVAPCRLMTKTSLHSLNTGGVLEIKFVASAGWPTGRYRARLDYSGGPATGNTPPKVVYSSEFLLS